MATYNGAKYIREQLDSFVAQTRLPDELIICDDGSSDETIEILNAFAEHSSLNVHVQRNPKNLGYAQNFNKALSLCTGDLIFLSDQDDVWFPTKIATITEAAETDFINQVFMNDAELTYEDLRPTELTKLGQIRKAGMLERTFVMGCCVAIKRRFLQDVLPIPEGYGSHDLWIVNMAQGLDRRRIIEKKLQYYRRHENNESLFIANNTKPINKLTYLCHQIASRVNGNSLYKLEQSSRKIDYLINKLKQIKSDKDIEYITIDEINKYLNVLICTKEATKMRLEILKMPRGSRIAQVTKMLIHGQYKFFYGAKSALSDILFD